MDGIRDIEMRGALHAHINVFRHNQSMLNIFRHHRQQQLEFSILEVLDYDWMLKIFNY
jgi:hypothetical protein